MSERKAPPLTGEFLRQAAANAVGTITAALILFLFGALLGVIDDVPFQAWATALVSLAALLAGFASFSLAHRRKRAVSDAERLQGMVTHLRNEKGDEAFAVGFRRVAREAAERREAS